MIAGAAAASLLLLRNRNRLSDEPQFVTRNRKIRRKTYPGKRCRCGSLAEEQYCCGGISDE